MAVHYSIPPAKELIIDPSNQFPSWAIGRMVMTNGPAAWVGTGSLIHTELIITAAHVVAGKTAGTISFGYDVDDIPGSNQRTRQIAAAAVPQLYGQQPGWDIAVARLATPYNPPQGAMFSVTGQGNDRATALHAVKPNQPIAIYGYPGAGPVTPTEHAPVELGHMYAKEGPLFACDFSVNKVQYRFDTRGGESGSPLFNRPNGRCQIVGVHTNWEVADAKQVGGGTLITDQVLAWIGRAINNLQGVGTFVRVVA